MSLKRQVLECSIAHWHNNFTGISALSISDQLSCSHDDVLAIFEALYEEGFCSLRRNVKLYTQEIDLSDPDWSQEFQEVDTIIFFPSDALLTETFYSSDLVRQNLPEYVIRLHRGASQLRLCYFSIGVLRKYLDHPETYSVDDGVSGGYLSFSDAYYEAFESEEDLEGAGYMHVRYGKRNLANGGVSVTAILHDLSEIPDEEQRYWHAFELNNPEFSQDDSDFDAFYRRNFEAEWVDYDDPLEAAIDDIRRLNDLFERGLFTRNQNIYLSYPVANTYKNLCDICSELYKLVGPDSINIHVLKDLLRDGLGYSDEDFIHEESGRNKSKLQLLGLLSERIDSANTLLDSIREIGEYRVSADHRILEPQNPDRNYITEFREICERLHQALSAFIEEISDLLSE